MSMTDTDRSQPPHAPVAPDDAKNYQAAFIWGTIVNALKAGWNHAVTFATTVRMNTSLRVGSGSATLAASDGADGFIIADGASAAVQVRDRADSTKNFIWYENSTIRLNSTQGGDLWLINATTGIIAPGVQTASLTNSWANFGAPYGNAGYWKDIHGVVHLEGAVKSGTLGAAIFTLASGFRPLTQQDFVAENNGAASSILVKTDGTVVTNSGTNTFVSLAGMTFRTV